MGSKDSQRMRRWGMAAVAVLAFVAAACGPQPGTDGPGDGTRSLLCADGPYDLGGAHPVAFSNSGDRLLARWLDEESVRYSVFDLVTGAQQPIDHVMEGDGAETHFSADGGTVLFGEYEPDPDESRWQLYDVRSATLRPALEGLGPRGHVVAVDEDVERAIVGEDWADPDSAYRLVDLSTGDGEVIGYRPQDPGWIVRSISPDLAHSLQGSTGTGAVRSVRLVSNLTGEVVRSLGQVRSGSAYNLFAHFVDTSTLLFTDAEPLGSPSDGTPGDSAFLQDVNTAAVTRIDPGIAGARTAAVTPDGARQLYYTGNFEALWLRQGEVHRQVADQVFPVVSRNLQVMAYIDMSGSAAVCL